MSVRAKKYLKYSDFEGNPSEKRLVEGIVQTMNAEGIILDNEEFTSFFDDCVEQFLDSKFTNKMVINRYKCYDYISKEIDRYISKKYISEKSTKFKKKSSKGSNTKIIKALSEALEMSIKRHGYESELSISISNTLDKFLKTGSVASGD